MRTLIIYFSLLFATGMLSAEEAKITIDPRDLKQGEISPMIYGGFIEFLNDFINGPFGMWSQELQNRGFDQLLDTTKYIADYWQEYRVNCPKGEISLKKVGYNPNGVYYQRLKANSDSGAIGLAQKVYLSDTTSNIFYIYLKGTLNSGRIEILISDTNHSKIYFSYGIDKISEEWTKYSVEIPYIEGLYKAKLIIALIGRGEVDIDEASLMPSNNIGGVRAEFFNAYKAWQPGLIRYPGGWFADTWGARWEFGIGPIDERRSPNFAQRLDFGTNEFVAFCKSTGIEPHIVVNLERGTAIEAANWVEYCNGDGNSNYGKLRVQNGDIVPYGVKYWEIGNEQYKQPLEMAKNYVKFFDSMKLKDPMIKTMVDGNVWGGSEYFSTVMNIVRDKCDYYGWHYIQLGTKCDSTVSDEDIFLCMMGGSKQIDMNLREFDDWYKQAGLNNIVSACTEWWNGYRIPEAWDDSEPRAFTLESGLWIAGHIMAFARNPSLIGLANKTSGLGLIKLRENSFGRRVFWLTPGYYALELLTNHRGNKALEYGVTCETYNNPPHEGIWSLYNVPWLDLSPTISDDTLFIAAINRHPSEQMETEINLPNEFFGRRSIIYELSSQHYLDKNTEEQPDLVRPQFKEWTVSAFYTFPKHSLTIIAIPLQGDSVDNTPLPTSIDAWPNPFSDKLSIVIPEKDINSHIDIYDISGKMVLSEDFTSPSGIYKISTMGLAQGFYTARIVNGRYLQVLKLQKE